MSQKKVDQHKYEKQNRKKLENKKKAKQLGWVFAGCIVFGLIIGYVAGKFWLYPIYREKEGYYIEATPEQQYESDLNNAILQQLNSMAEEQLSTEEGASIEDVTEEGTTSGDEETAGGTSAESE